MGCYHRPGYWPTPDGVIPIPEFDRMEDSLLSLGYAARLEGALAHAHGRALSRDQSAVRSQTEEWTRRAYPSIPLTLPTP